MYQPTPSARNPLTVEQLNRLYKRSPSLPLRIILPQIKLLVPTSVLVTASALVLLTPKPTANEDAILRRLKKQELEKKVTLDPFESPKPAPGSFTGGQGICILYRVTYDLIQDNSPVNKEIRIVYGPIIRIYLIKIASGATEIYMDCNGTSSSSCVPKSIFMNRTFSKKVLVDNVVVTRIDGLPDTEGNSPNFAPPQIRPNTIVDPNRFKRERGDRPAPAATPKYFDPRPTIPGGGWGHAVPPDKRRQTIRSGTPTPTPTRTPTAIPSPAPTKVYFPQKQPVEIAPQPAPLPTPQERPFPPQSVPDGISPQPIAQPLAPPSQKTDTAPIPIPTSRPAVSPAAPVASPNPNRTPTAIPAPNPTPQPVIIYGPASDPGSAGPITYSSPPQNFAPNPTTLAPQPQAPPQVKPPTEPAPTKTPIEEIGQKFRDLAIPIGTIAVGITQILQRTTPEQLEAAAEKGTCRTAQPGGCTTAAINKGNQDLLAKLGLAGGQTVDLLTLAKIDNKLGNQITGGLSGGIGRLSNFLGIDRIFNLLTFLATLHNASMLTSSLKVTLLETLASVGNATGLLETSEGNNVDLNKTFNQGIEAFIVGLVGVDTYAQMTLAWRKYNPIFRAGSNVLSNVGNMFSSIGNGINVERTGKMGNALRAAGAVRENAYNYMSENMNVHTNKFMTFQTTVGGVTEVLEAINEVAESVVEGQEAYTESVKATTQFKKALAEGEKKPGIDADNAVIKAEADKIKANLVKDPTGEDETGLLSFLTDF